MFRPLFRSTHRRNLNDIIGIIVVALPGHGSMTDLDLHTDRLVLRPLAPADTEPLHALWTAPGVRQYLWDDEVITFDRTTDVVAAPKIMAFMAHQKSVTGNTTAALH